jgi:prepilin-type N-terminal cleavage/methylation domain-containing protein
MTLVELLLVIAIIGILAALTANSFSRTKDQAQEAVCKVYKQQLIVHYVGYEEERGIDFLVKRDTILDRCWECHPTLP